MALSPAATCGAVPFAAATALMSAATSADGVATRLSS